MTVTTYDPNSLVLAEHFLQDEQPDGRRASLLAFAIQQAVEDWLEEFPEPCRICGNEERHPRTGLHTCECPTPISSAERPRQE